MLTYNKTMPREVSAFFGCSYYNIIIKPLYKLINKYQYFDIKGNFKQSTTKNIKTLKQKNKNIASANKEK